MKVSAKQEKIGPITKAVVYTKKERGGIIMCLKLWPSGTTVCNTTLSASGHRRSEERIRAALCIVGLLLESQAVPTEEANKLRDTLFRQGEITINGKTYSL